MTQCFPPVIAILPARYASSRFPGKPLAVILGKSLIQLAYENAQRCRSLTRIVVATDDIRIYNHVRSFGGEVVMTDPSCLTGTDRLADALQNTSLCDISSNAIILNIQGDEPCVDPQIIESVITVFHEDKNSVMSTAVTRLHKEEGENPSIVKCVLDLQGHTLYYSRALIPCGKHKVFSPQTSYYRHIGIYAYSRDFLIKYASLPPTPLQLAEDIEALKILEYGYRIKAAIVDGISIGVDHPEDIKKVEQYLCSQNNHKNLSTSS